ncbi:MAG: phosphatase PAP2 family protein [Bacteriovoracaceae bacterium]
MHLIKTIFFLVLFSLPLFADDEVKTTHLENFASPLTTNASYILIGGSLATANSWASHDSYAYEKRISYRDSQPFKQFGVIGAVLGLGFLNFGYSGLNYYYGKKDGNEKYLKRSNLMLQSTFYSLLWALILKTSVSEKRPGYPDQDDSFPSGHSTASFAFASYIAAEHGWWWGTATYALAGFIAISRINDDFHYLHDTLAGATIGASYGWGIYLLNSSEQTDSILTHFSPGVTHDSYSLTYRYEF